MEILLADNIYKLRKFPGKGGWTYAEITEVGPDTNALFNWVRVKGSIDGYEIKGYHLMPMGNNRLFLPVKAEIRKKIKKEEGDDVRIILYEDKLPLELPEELKECLEADNVLDTFISLSEGQKKGFLNWIYSAKQDETKVERIAKTIDMLLKGQKYYKQ